MYASQDTFIHTDIVFAEKGKMFMLPKSHRIQMTVIFCRTSSLSSVRHHNEVSKKKMEKKVKYHITHNTVAEFQSRFQEYKQQKALKIEFYAFPFFLIIAKVVSFLIRYS